jgi:nucleolar MIF4G domain-containing protein 1
VTELVINLVSDRANLLDSFVILYAALLAALYKVKGLEFGMSDILIDWWFRIAEGRLTSISANLTIGAHVVQTLVLKYKTLVDQLQGTAAEEEQAGKQPLNMLTLIAELYNFQVISCRLIYDLIRGFIENIVPQGTEVTGVEFPVEGLLKVLRGMLRLSLHNRQESELISRSCV